MWLNTKNHTETRVGNTILVTLKISQCDCKDVTFLNNNSRHKSSGPYNFSENFYCRAFVWCHATAVMFQSVWTFSVWFAVLWLCCQLLEKLPLLFRKGRKKLNFQKFCIFIGTLSIFVLILFCFLFCFVLIFNFVCYIKILHLTMVSFSYLHIGRSWNGMMDINVTCFFLCWRVPVFIQSAGQLSSEILTTTYLLLTSVYVTYFELRWWSMFHNMPTLLPSNEIN